MKSNQRIHIAICDDEQIIRNLIKTYILEQYENCFISEYASGETLLEACGNTHKKPDLLFLDIEFPNGMNGMEIADEIRSMDTNDITSAISSLPFIIFVTGDSSRMPDAFHVHAFHYIVKPIRKPDFQRILGQAIQEFNLLHKNNTDQQRKMVVRCDGGTQSIPLPDIDYFESEGRKLTIHTKGQRISFYGKITEAESEAGDGFFRIHRGFLVNMNRIRRYTHAEVELVTGDLLPMSKQKYPLFVKSYMRFISEGG